ncbi:hypothetical protein J5N97_023188 [Dioscorea zingiberensis]|uniref:Uncharacterized protein n=1 Tax=Dioscorea zingiberensis TaxID=325984 RepID=A0A9D5CBK0_9LILI|nr:hypothetical protein J5N97_023188 [Dioscorea zingiberensis]
MNHLLLPHISISLMESRMKTEVTMVAKEEESFCFTCRSFRQRTQHMVEQQKARFYILRRCIVMLLCWRENNDA